MAGVFKFRADPLLKRANDTGYRIGWKHRYDLVRGHLDGEMTFGEATKKAAELGAKDKDKIYWAEMIMDPKFEKIG
ncbi:MAG: hypothetical protein HY080_14125 [Gammaproteobacteria bacterium]|nr:hypothetical protein [Gammaproteobacteria bacterium]